MALSIGIDFGHASLRLVGVQQGRKLTVTGCAEVAVDPKWLQKEGFENHNGIAEALKEGLKKASPKPIKGKEVYVTVSESMVFRKLIELPPAPTEEELTTSVRMEAAQYLPEAVDEMEIDYQVLGAATENGILQVMVVAVNRRIVHDMLEVIMAAKLVPKAFEPKPESVGRTLVSPSEKDAVLLVDIGQSRSTVSVYDQGMVRVTSAVNLGTSSLLEGGETDPAVMQERLPRLVSQISDEIDHVMKFYQNRTIHLGSVKKLQISGAGSLVEGAGEAIARAVDLTVAKSQPVIAVPAECDRRFFGALGAALYPFSEKI
jgi:Tfp pilus assembly PilM family ATPase